MQLLGATEQRFLGLGIVGIGDAAFDRADGLARLVVVEADALGAKVGIDYVNIIAFADGLVRAFRLASADGRADADADENVDVGGGE